MDMKNPKRPENWLIGPEADKEGKKSTLKKSKDTEEITVIPQTSTGVWVFFLDNKLWNIYIYKAPAYHA